MKDYNKDDISLLFAKRKYGEIFHVLSNKSVEKLDEDTFRQVGIEAAAMPKGSMRGDILGTFETQREKFAPDMKIEELKPPAIKPKRKSMKRLAMVATALLISSPFAAFALNRDAIETEAAGADDRTAKIVEHVDKDMDYDSDELKIYNAETDDYLTFEVPNIAEELGEYELGAVVPEDVVALEEESVVVPDEDVILDEDAVIGDEAYGSVRGALDAIATETVEVPELGEMATIIDEVPEIASWRLEAVETARTLLGTPYLWGGKPSNSGWFDVTGEVPRSEVRGLDCSGFTKWIFGEILGDFSNRDLVHFGAGTWKQSNHNPQIPFEEVQPGDLAFNSRHSHVGMVTGFNENGDMMVIHSSGSQGGVVETPLRYYRGAPNENMVFSVFYRPHDGLISALEATMAAREIAAGGRQDNREYGGIR